MSHLVWALSCFAFSHENARTPRGQTKSRPQTGSRHVDERAGEEQSLWSHGLCSTVQRLQTHRTIRLTALPMALRICLLHPKAASQSSRARVSLPELKSSSSSFSQCDK